MNPTTRIKLFCGGSVLAGFVLCLAAVRFANVSLSAAGAIRLACPDGDYTWKSNDAVISFATTTEMIPSRYDPYNKEPVVSVTALETNILSGSHSALSEFQALLSSDHEPDITTWRVSPDGKRLLYGGGSSGSYTGDEAAPLSIWALPSGDIARVDPEVYAGINYTAGSAIWMPDSSLLLIGNDDSGSVAALFNTESPDDASVAIPLAARNITALGVTPDNRITYTNLPVHIGSIVTVFVQPILTAQTTPQEFTPKLNAGDTILEMALSPRGDRLAWAISSIHTPPGYRFLRRIAPRFAARIAPHPVVSLCLSRLDGTHMRRLGMEDNPPGAQDEMVRNIQWRPNGKWLSYRWHKGVYMVPAE